MKYFTTIIVFLTSNLYFGQCNLFINNYLNNIICQGDTVQINQLNNLTIFNMFGFYNQLYLPDGSGQNYVSTVVISGHNGAVIDTESKIKVCINLEHSYLGDLEMMLTSPNGIEINLFNAYTGNGLFPGGFGGGSTFLGGANDNGAPGVIGVCENYCFYDHSSSLPSWNNGYSTVPTSFPQGSFTGSQMVAPGVYKPEQSFSNLIGETIDGNWKLSIRDNLSIDDGIVCHWSLHVESTYTGSWNTAIGIGDSSELDTHFFPSQTTQYFYVATDDITNCSDTLNLTILVANEIPTAQIQGLNYVEQSSIVNYNTLYKQAYNYSWNVTNGTILQGQNTNEISVLWNQPGNGTLYALVQNDTCIQLGKLVSMEVAIGYTNVNEVETAFKIYPNPASKSIFIDVNKPIQNIELYSIQGELLIYQKFNNGKNHINLDVSSFENGMYILLLIDEQMNRYKEIITKID